MLFNSIDFAIFFPICFLLYWFFFSKNARMQNIFIILASVFFYGYWSIQFLPLLLFVAALCYSGGYLINRYKANNPQKAKTAMISVVVINLALLFYFKYFNFFILSFVDAFSLFGHQLSLGALNIILPVGISFYIFTGMSYTIDVYTGVTKHTNDIAAYLAYVLFFPCIFCGPISRSDDQLPQYYNKRVFDYDETVQGAKWILWGLFMKLCVADRLGLYVDAVYNNIPYHNGTSILVATLFYTIQLYTDFGGYSLIAKGVGNFFGIRLKDNFMRPYQSVSFSDYWKREHMSLTNWLMDYVYYPLIGSSSRLAWWNACMIITFLISGLWHGAAFTFILWGLYQGIFIVLDSNNLKIRKKFEKKHGLKNKMWWKLTMCTFTYLIVFWGLIFFRANTVNDSLAAFCKIFTVHGPLFVDKPSMVYGGLFAVMLIFKDFTDEFYPSKFLLFENTNKIVRWISYLSITVIIMLFSTLEGGSFIYFQF